MLIVVGILIAVQIGDWKEARQLEARRLDLIDDLQKDFRTNLDRLKASINTLDQNNEDLKAFLKVASGDNLKTDSDDLRRMANSGFRHVIFKPALGSYNAAVSTGDIGLLKSPLLNELVAEFEQTIEDFLRHDSLSGNMMFLGSFWEVRRQLGSLHHISDPGYFQPEAFALSDQEYREFFALPKVYAAFENMQWIYRNELEILTAAHELTETILRTLEEL